jgi:hypothetical protein
MGEHTPTPWHFEELAGGSRDGCGYVRCETDHLEISHHGDMGRSREENLANAALIVKAVNNHDALVKALQFYADYDRYNGPNQRLIGTDSYTPEGQGYLQDVTRDDGNIAREALAKASLP